MAERPALPEPERLPRSIDFEARSVSFVILLVYLLFALGLFLVWCFCRFEPKQPLLQQARAALAVL